jgi:hypothetical protein
MEDTRIIHPLVGPAAFDPRLTTDKMLWQSLVISFLSQSQLPQPFDCIQVVEVFKAVISFYLHHHHHLLLLLLLNHFNPLTPLTLPPPLPTPAYEHILYIHSRRGQPCCMSGNQCLLYPPKNHRVRDGRMVELLQSFCFVSGTKWIDPGGCRRRGGEGGDHSPPAWHTWARVFIDSLNHFSDYHSTLHFLFLPLSTTQAKPSQANNISRFAIHFVHI